MDQFAADVIALIKEHPNLAALLIGLTAFGESFAIISFFIPGSTILVAAGALVQAGAIDPVTASVSAAVGALLGDAMSFWIGQRFGKALPNRWPFRKHHATLDRGVEFFRKYGWASVFIGRFLGPLRAFVPLAAGMCRMPAWKFYLTAVVSAAIWAPALLYSGYLIGMVAGSGWSNEIKIAVIAGTIAGFILLGFLVRRIFRSN